MHENDDEACTGDGEDVFEMDDVSKKPVKVEATSGLPNKVEVTVAPSTC